MLDDMPRHSNILPLGDNTTAMRLLPDNKNLGWLPYAWLVYVIFFAAYPAMTPHPTALQWIATGSAVLVFLPLYFYGYWPRGAKISMIGMTALGVLFLPFNPGAGAFFVYAAATAGWSAEPPRSHWILAALDVLLIAECLIFHISIFNALWPVLFVIIVGGANAHGRNVAQNNARLRLAQHEIEHLAKMAERERIARDLHDLLGQTLSVIILKSELASKLANRDIERARVEINDVERISRDALAQVRNAVRGYRAGGLTTEIGSARDALSAAGVALDARLDSLPLSPVQEAVLSLAVREAVTNIVRHANAGHCSIVLEAHGGKAMLTVADDGKGGPLPLGFGLRGMRERTVALGGTLDCDGSHGTTLTVTMPLPHIRLVGDERLA
jgi:two-component system sensor histidine kinase DesK